ncbi:MAG: four-carbon acid sugar kinase family protein [Thermoanaerobacteraceae bacterium]|jgi:uncharacterized protein YgbK (DUF1537 family)|nr:four-carbon acid sugar kinase family protein [Thermoanaerobacteraceae bacterium]
MGYLSIIADDLTGASDTGIQFRKYGLKTKVIVDINQLEQFLDGDEVLAINSNTRPLKGEKAYKIVYDISRQLKEAGFTCIYKKVDSTFRGNPGIELEAVMDALGANLAVLVPSFPDNGRYMVSGNLKISQVLTSGNSKEDIISINEGDQQLCHVPTIIRNQMRRKAANIDIKIVRQGIPAIINKVEKFCEKGYQVMIIDAVTKDDLKNIAFACKSLPQNTVMAGAAGLAAFLPMIFDVPSNIEDKLSSKEGLILVVAGTFNQTTKNQIDEVIKRTGANLIIIDTDRIIEGKTQEEIEKVVEKIQQLYKIDRIKPSLFIIAVDTLFKPDVDDSQIRKWSKTIAEAIGGTVRTIIDKATVQSIIITGGDTALHVLNALKAKGIDLEKEILPGIPLGRLIGGKANEIPVITKAGGFGTSKALLEVIRHLQTTGNKKNINV